MKKPHKITYWVATIWLSLGMVSTGLVQLIGNEEEREMFSRLGYPPYLMTLLGVLKIIGVIVVLIPRFPLLKEWAYAGAIFSHIASGTANELFGPSLLLFLTVVSWYFRPPNRRVGSARQIA
jgi:uncharacterized membrane protein YphA (DoxX/SURF4 family)